MNIAILSYYSGINLRGVETWAKDLSDRLPNIEVISGLKCFNPQTWLKYDVLIPTNGRLQALLCWLFSIITKKKVVIFGHSGPGADDKWNLLCRPNVFVCFTKTQIDWAKKYKLQKTMLALIPHAVDTQKFTPGSKPPAPVVLCVAANHPDKRVDLVKNAVKLLPGVALRIVGHGQPEQVDHEHMPDIYRQASVFCFVPRPHEAFGLVFLEAMACNLPVVTISDPIREEIVGNAGICIKHPQNPQELSMAIQKALSKKWGNIPRQQAQKFSWDTVVPLYEKLFNSL